MSNASVPTVYRWIIDDVIKKVLSESGLDEGVVQELQQIWEAKLLQTKVAPFQPPLFTTESYAQPAPSDVAPLNPAVAGTSSKQRGPAQQNTNTTAALGMASSSGLAPSIDMQLPGQDLGPLVKDEPEEYYSNPTVVDNSLFYTFSNFRSPAGTPTSIPTTPSSSAAAAATAGPRIPPNPFQISQTDGESGDAVGAAETLVNGNAACVVGPRIRAEGATGSGKMSTEEIDRVLEERWAAKNRRLTQTDGKNDDDDDDDDDEDDGDAEIGSDLDDDESDDEEQEVEHMVLCQYEKVTRTKNKWKCVLKDGIVNVNGKDYLFTKANCDFEW